MQIYNGHDESVTVEKNEQSTVNFYKILNIIRANWHWFILSLIVALIVAILYLRYTTPVYMVKSEIIIKDQQKGGGSAGFGDAELLTDLGLNVGKSNVENELRIIKSRNTMQKVVEKLQLTTKPIN